ncbi:hypothetical protein MSAN_02207400 [Mycena sanguinolenta]|uniref:F-box domain-containing protein n=1 Tax=Mycena sanguinolenta TaxID=230812 RepID=A0A8H7CIM2_9AGAR|nr:hypothetical protein MSAN_02207400 [Mycena sanguinolenta]
MPTISRVFSDGRDTFPMEVWTTIFLQLDDDGLFQVAGVCHPFNELAMFILFLANGVTRAALAAGHVVVPGRLLPALLRARFIPPLKFVTVAMEQVTTDSKFSVQLCILSALIARSPELLDVELRFPASKRGEEIFSTSRAICALTAHMPDVTLATQHGFSRCPKSRLHRYFFAMEDRYLPKPPPRAWIMSSQASTRLHCMVDKPSSFMTIFVNEHEISGLGETEDHWVADFYRATYTVFLSWTVPSRPRPAKNDFLFQLPTALPMLTGLRTINMSLRLMLAFLDATQDIPIRSISFVVPHADENGMTEFEDVLRKISQRTTPIMLALDIESPYDNKLFTEGDLTVPRSLYCVDVLDVTHKHLEDCAALLPWLAELPALDAVGFTAEHAGDLNVSDFEETVKSIFTFPEVQVQVYKVKW